VPLGFPDHAVTVAMPDLPYVQPHLADPQVRPSSSVKVSATDSRRL